MLSSPSSSYFLFNTPLMVTPFLSYNWKTKEKKQHEAREILSVSGDEQDRCNPQQGFPNRSTWPCRCDSQKVLSLKHLILLHSLCTPVNFSPISQHCRRNYPRHQTVQKLIQSTQMSSNSKYYILLTNSFMFTPHPDRFLCSYSFNVLLITKISQFAENNLLA